VAETHHSIRVPLGPLHALEWGPERRHEPITIGVPLPAGQAFSPSQILLDAPFNLVTTPQIRALDLIAGTSPAQPATPPPHVRVSANERIVKVDTGAATFGFEVGGAFPFSSIDIGGHAPIDVQASGFHVDATGAPIAFRIRDVHVHETGPNRAEIELEAGPVAPAPVEVAARLECFAGSATVRVAITIRNPRRAKHPNGQWVLGDEGSVQLQSASLTLVLLDAVQRVQCAVETGEPLRDVDRPFELSQESSGGDGWNGPIHRNRDARVPLRFRGYRMRSGTAEHAANRATPIVIVETGRGELAVTLPRFWENFPRAIEVGGQTIGVGFFPRQAPEPHELQGGEQKTHEAVIAFRRDNVSDPPLAWCHNPMFAYPSPEWCCATGAVPYLIPEQNDPERRYVDLVSTSLDAADGFDAKNERADEYGWRNFGELHADHESAFQPDRPLVSHYNNQYDAIDGFGMHFLRTGDRRWWRLMGDLARHVRDIDIYRTTEDKAAYNGGLFWHTAHYTDAGTATHRTYPLGAPGGGPSAEHNYSAGLMLHYFMTGDRTSRDTAIGLARWAIDMDDGRLTVFRWLAGGATGHASATGSVFYHGPGRGPANSIRACLVAARLTRAHEYTAKAEELIRRCIHPDDDVDARELFDVERRWYYTVFLQTLGHYLHQKRELGQLDAMYAYARDSLLRYGRWMAAHERPYLEHPEVLEFPNDTWAAQDIRKADVLAWAAEHASLDEREGFLERARFFFDYSVNALAASPQRVFTRILVLLLSNGVRFGWVQAHRATLPLPTVLSASPHPPAPAPFEPQKTRAMRRARVFASAAAFAIAGLVTWLLVDGFGGDG
jgi:hypothetical protein